MLRLFGRKKVHKHTGYMWDGFYEFCKCGASAGDRRDENGFRHLFFKDWPKTSEETHEVG